MYFLHLCILITDILIKLITMNKTLISRLARTTLLQQLPEGCTWVPKHAAVCICVMYIVSQSAFVGKCMTVLNAYGYVP